MNHEVEALRAQVLSLTTNLGLVRAQASLANKRAERLALRIADWLEQNADDLIGSGGATLREAAELIRTIDWTSSLHPVAQEQRQGDAP